MTSSTADSAPSTAQGGVAALDRGELTLILDVRLQLGLLDLDVAALVGANDQRLAHDHVDEARPNWIAHVHAASRTRGGCERLEARGAQEVVVAALIGAGALDLHLKAHRAL